MRGHKEVLKYRYGSPGLLTHDKWIALPRRKALGWNHVSSNYRVFQQYQLTTDGWKPYQEVVEAVFAGDIDYAQLVKTYGKTDTKSPDRKYSPPEFVCASKRPINGWPLEGKISTSYVERQNLTMRMSMRRFARLTNAFSKKVENLAHAVSLHFMYYNFARIHKSLRVTPAMEAGVSDHVWELEEIAQLIDSYPQAK